MKLINQTLFLYVVITLIEQFSAYPNGAPPSVCESLRPNHRDLTDNTTIIPQAIQSPFELVVSKLSATGGELIGIEVQAPAGDYFKGFFLLAFTNENIPRIVGEFSKDEEDETAFNLRDCRSGSSNAVTHADPSEKQKISLKWRAPENFDGSIHF